jgi:hypothetical protein
MSFHFTFILGLIYQIESPPELSENFNPPPASIFIDLYLKHEMDNAGKT